MSRRRARGPGRAPLDGEGLPPGAYSRAPAAGAGGPAAPVEASGAEDLGVLGPIFAWFEGGDVLQFGNLCPSCPPDVRGRCQSWRQDTLDGIATKEARSEPECPFFVKWDSEVLTVARLTAEELEEGRRNPSTCPSCGKDGLATAVRASSEFGTRMNPRMATFRWCDCGFFSAEKRRLDGDRERCVFCGHPAAPAESTVFGGALYHVDCFLRLRFFFTMGEMLGVARGYAVTGRTLGLKESEEALRKTLRMVRAFRITGNAKVLGVNRVIHWLQGESPLVTDRTVLRSRKELVGHLQNIFGGDGERSVGIHILEDAFIIYNSAGAVRWITHGCFRPAKGVLDFVDSYVDPAGKGDWASLENLLMREIPDGKCVLCGATTRSHRIAAGENENNVYVCHHCWTGGPRD